MVGGLEAEQKRMEAEQNQSRFEQAVFAAQQAVTLAKLGLDSAIRSHEVALESRRLVDSAVPLRSLEQQLALLGKQVEMSRMVAPLDGVVLSVSAKKGEMVSQLPLLEIADLSSMVCEAEVSDASVRFLEVGQVAVMDSAALEKPLRGIVYRIDRMVGSPQMKVPSPLAKTDFRAVPVWIEIAAEDMAAAAKLVQLHVDVTIELKPTKPTDSQATEESAE
jgi:HlyD family secretion protein